jgi:hypothetical protein
VDKKRFSRVVGVSNTALVKNGYWPKLKEIAETAGFRGKVTRSYFDDFNILRDRPKLMAAVAQAAFNNGLSVEQRRELVRMFSSVRGIM